MSIFMSHQLQVFVCILQPLVNNILRKKFQSMYFSHLMILPAPFPGTIATFTIGSTVSPWIEATRTILSQCSKSAMFVDDCSQCMERHTALTQAVHKQTKSYIQDLKTVYLIVKNIMEMNTFFYNAQPNLI